MLSAAVIGGVSNAVESDRENYLTCCRAMILMIIQNVLLILYYGVIVSSKYH